MNKFEKTTIFLVAFAVALLVIYSIISWSIENDKATQAIAENYEVCIRDEYHTTPSGYYDKHGKWPECK